MHALWEGVLISSQPQAPCSRGARANPTVRLQHLRGALRAENAARGAPEPPPGPKAVQVHVLRQDVLRSLPVQRARTRVFGTQWTEPRTRRGG